MRHSTEIDRAATPRPYLSRGKAVFPRPTPGASGKLPGFVPPACNQRISWEQGRSIRFRRKPVGPDKLARRGRSDGLVEVRLADSTPRSGEPATWGSGQQKMNCSGETWALSKERSGLLCKEKISQPWKRDSEE